MVIAETASLEFICAVLAGHQMWAWQEQDTDFGWLTRVTDCHRL